MNPKGVGYKYRRLHGHVIALLVAGMAPNEIAKKLKIMRATLTEWMQRPDFKLAYDQARSAVFADAMQEMKVLAKAAVDSLRNCLTDPDAGWADKNKAATTILDIAAGCQAYTQLEAQAKEVMQWCQQVADENLALKGMVPAIQSLPAPDQEPEPIPDPAPEQEPSRKVEPLFVENQMEAS
jgi:hypothetical protein